MRAAHSQVDMPKLRLPVLAFANPEDDTVSFTETRRQLGNMPSGELEVRADHHAHISAPREGCGVLLGVGEERQS